jgi:hypothetical protein
MQSAKTLPTPKPLDCTVHFPSLRQMRLDVVMQMPGFG